MVQEDLNAMLQPSLDKDKVADIMILKIRDIEDLEKLKLLLSNLTIDRKKLILEVLDKSLLESVSELDLNIIVQSDMKEAFKLAKLVGINVKLQTNNWKEELADLDFSTFPEKTFLFSNKVNDIAFYRLLNEKKIKNPILVSYTVDEKHKDSSMLASTVTGSVLCDGIGNGIYVQIEDQYLESMTLSYNILQACRLRMSKTEYISCPSCGRTLFDLEETTAEIKKYTGHLKGVKIAVMGCIVNGPGEMADADFGYVGSGPGKINLYVGKELVKRNINSQNAVHELIDLIKTHNMWVEEEYA